MPLSSEFKGLVQAAVDISLSSAIFQLQVMLFCYNEAMHFDVFTLFPDVMRPYLDTSILQRAQSNGLISIGLHNIRDWTSDRHHVTDDAPYGGGGGMVMKVEPIFAAVEAVLGAPLQAPLIYLSPQGKPFTTTIAKKLASQPRLGLLCGRYEGVDERVREHLVDEEISIGDYVLTGGELAALVVIDALARHMPGVLGDEHAAQQDSYANGLLEGPHYTRPEIFHSWAVPEVLRSGHAGHIERWRREQALRRTWERRPELLLTAELDEADRQFLMILAREMAEKL